MGSGRLVLRTMSVMKRPGQKGSGARAVGTSESWGRRPVRLGDREIIVHRRRGAATEHGVAIKFSREVSWSDQSGEGL